MPHPLIFTLRSPALLPAARSSPAGGRGLSGRSVPLAGPVAQAERELSTPSCPQPARAVQRAPGKTAPPGGRGHTAGTAQALPGPRSPAREPWKVAFVRPSRAAPEGKRAKENVQRRKGGVLARDARPRLGVPPRRRWDQGEDKLLERAWPPRWPAAMALTRLWSRLLRKPAPSGHGAPAEYEVSELFQAPAQLGFPGGGPPSRLPLGARRDRRDSHVEGGLGRPQGRRAISPGQTQLVRGTAPPGPLLWDPSRRCAQASTGLTNLGKAQEVETTWHATGKLVLTEPRG